MVKRLWVLMIALMLACPAWSLNVSLKSLAKVVGVRGNHLVGYGLVVGLPSTGDTGKAFATVESVLRLLESLGVSVPRQDLVVSNCAAVIVTAKLPPSIRAGESVDVQVSSLGNARSLAGGTLVMAPLKGMNGQTYAVAQGPVSTGGYAMAPGSQDSLQKNQPTVGRIPAGALIERAVSAQFISGTALALGLAETNFLAASRVVTAMNAKFGTGVAKSEDGSRIDVALPSAYADKVVDFLAEAGELSVDLPDPQKVVVNERTGVVVIGGQIRIAPVSVTHGNLHLAVTSRSSVSQPNALASGNTEVVNQLELKAQEESARTAAFNAADATVETLVRGLAELGATPRDIIAILQDVHALGAMPAEIEIR
jgi:flagellar P-ring protein precursor FlgI